LAPFRDLGSIALPILFAIGAVAAIAFVVFKSRQ
jgi:hypothetical protein